MQLLCAHVNALIIFAQSWPGHASGQSWIAFAHVLRSKTSPSKKLIFELDPGNCFTMRANHYEHDENDETSASNVL